MHGVDVHGAESTSLPWFKSVISFTWYDLNMIMIKLTNACRGTAPVGRYCCGELLFQINVVAVWQNVMMHQNILVLEDSNIKKYCLIFFSYAVYVHAQIGLSFYCFTWLGNMDYEF